MRERLLIIGGGMAATRLVEELVRASPGRYEISIVGAEPRLPYNRVLLSSLLAQEVAEHDIDLKPAAWWVEQGVTTYFGRHVSRVDIAANCVVLDTGVRLAFDRLVFATGSRGLRLPLPGAEMPGVVTFRDCADVATMRASVSAECRVAVIGGGLLGLEAAYGLAKAGAKVTVVHVMDRLMERQLDPAAAHLLKAELESRGIDVLLEARTTAITGSDKAEGLTFADGSTLAADLVVMAAGIQPNTQLAAEAGLVVNRGIRVDNEMRTSAPHVFAVGECAEHAGLVYGLVEPAYDQAKVLACVLAGGKAAYGGSITATNLKVSGVGVFSAGAFLGEAGTQSLTWRDNGLRLYRKLVLRECGRRTLLVGCVLYGDTADGLWYLDLIRSAQPIDGMRDVLIFGRALCDRLAA